MAPGATPIWSSRCPKSRRTCFASGATSGPKGTSTISCDDEENTRSEGRAGPGRDRASRRSALVQGRRHLRDCTFGRSYDSDGDGIGDFPGLTQKLDYLQDLGVTAIWLLPFYPSPLRDDGYDIADYTSVHPAYGTLADFKDFLREAHGRGVARDHRAGPQPHLGPASLVSAGAPGEAGLVRSATSTSGATRRRSTGRRGSSSRTSRLPTGPGTRSPRPTTGTASIPISRT